MEPHSNLFKIGQQFGRLKIKSTTYKDNKLLCECACLEPVWINPHSLDDQSKCDNCGKIESLDQIKLRQRFGNLVVISRKLETILKSPTNSRGRKGIKCVCDCGKDHCLKEILVSPYQLAKNRRKNCAKINRDRIINIGEQFGHLEIISPPTLRISPTARTSKKRTFYSVKCSCGDTYCLKVFWARASNLLKGQKRCDYQKNLPEGVSIFREIIGSYRMRARKKGLECTLTDKQFEILLQGNCYYCGTPPEKTRRRTRTVHEQTYTYNGIDRYDNEKGYTETNGFTCCWVCNDAKGKLSGDEFLEAITKIYNHTISSNT